MIVTRPTTFRTIRPTTTGLGTVGAVDTRAGSTKPSPAAIITKTANRTADHFRSITMSERTGARAASITTELPLK